MLKSLVLFYLLAAYLNATHIHDIDISNTDECQVCIVMKTFQSGDVPALDICEIALDYNIDTVDFLPFYTIIKLHKGYYSTAPPTTFS